MQFPRALWRLLRAVLHGTHGLGIVLCLVGLWLVNRR